MLRRALVMVLTAVALWSAAASAIAVTLPWEDTENQVAQPPGVALDMSNLSMALMSAGRSGFEGLKTARPAPGQSLIAGIVRAVLRKAPWLGGNEGTARGLWIWSRHPARGVAIYGPGIGGYNSFSWTRSPAAEPAALRGVARLQPALTGTGRNLLPAPGSIGSGGPTPVPLPPAAPLLLAALGAVALVKRRGKAKGHP